MKVKHYDWRITGKVFTPLLACKDTIINQNGFIKGFLGTSVFSRRQQGQLTR
jgi:hypothetical protein